MAAWVNRKMAWPDRAAAVHGVGDLRDHGLGVARDDVHLGGEPRDADEHRAEQHAHDGERLAGVLPLDRLERGHAVGDGLDAGHGRATRGEGVEHQHDRRRADRFERRGIGRHHVLEAAAEDRLVDTGGDHQEHGDDEQVGRDGEDLPGLLHAPEVADADDGDEGEGDRHPVGVERVEGRVEGGHAGRHRHRHGEDVVGEQGDAGDLGGQQSEVVLGDDVGTAGRRVGLDGLAVAEDQDHQHGHQGQGDRDEVREGEDADGAGAEEQRAEDLLAGVGRRRQCVGGEHGERGRLARGARAPAGRCRAAGRGSST